MQTSFSDLEYAGKKERTRRERFLAPFYPTGKGPGRPLLGLSRMLRMYVAQQYFGPSDQGVEERCVRKPRHSPLRRPATGNPAPAGHLARGAAPWHAPGPA